jgi:hypothetical protein
LRVVYGTSMPLARAGVADWRRVASAVLATTYELSTYLLDQRWVRVDEAIRERRELLAWFGRLPLDTEGRRCHMSLCQAAEESERAIAAMILASPGAGSA